MTRLAQLDNAIIAQKEAIDRTLQSTPRADHDTRLRLWYEWLVIIAPLVAEREALLGDVSIPDIAANYDPLLDSLRQWRRHD